MTTTTTPSPVSRDSSGTPLLSPSQQTLEMHRASWARGDTGCTLKELETQMAELLAHEQPDAETMLFGTGDDQPDIVFVAWKPSERELKNVDPFSAGYWDYLLDGAKLELPKLSLDERCRAGGEGDEHPTRVHFMYLWPTGQVPVDTDDDDDGVYLSAQTLCMPYIVQRLTILKPQVVVAIGKDATALLAGGLRPQTAESVQAFRLGAHIGDTRTEKKPTKRLGTDTGDYYHKITGGGMAPTFEQCRIHLFSPRGH